MLLTHWQTELRSLLREPLFLLPTLLFPLIFVGIYLPTLGTEQPAANDVTINAATFGALAVALLQFGSGTATERASTWERFVRALPVSASQRFVAKSATAAAIILVSAGIVVAVATIVSPAGFTLIAGVSWVVALLAGAVPLVLLGLAVGYWCSPRAATPTVLLLLSVLTFTGGMAGPVEEFPAAVETAAAYLPTAYFVTAVKAAAAGEFAVMSWLALAGYGAAFGALAWLGYSRERRRSYA